MFVVFEAPEAALPVGGEDFAVDAVEALVDLWSSGLCELRGECVSRFAMGLCRFLDPVLVLDWLAFCDEYICGE